MTSTLKGVGARIRIALGFGDPKSKLMEISPKVQQMGLWYGDKLLGTPPADFYSFLCLFPYARGSRLSRLNKRMDS